MLSIILTTAITLSVAHAAFRNGKAARNWNMIRSYRPVHFLLSIPILGLVITVAAILITYVPVMDKNPILWAVSGVFGGDGTGQGNVMFEGLRWKYYAILFLPLLLFALPSLARDEEEVFRAGTQNWRSGTVRSVVFGLMHLVVLIPLGAALALSIGGLWFTHQYFQGGVERSSTYHAAYNSIIVSILLVLAVLS